MRLACDGYVGPDGRAGWGWVCDCGAQGQGALPEMPSHLAEWRACAEGLAHLDAHGPGEVVLQVDAALVAKGLGARRPAMSGEAAELRAACRQRLAALAAKGVPVRVERVPRESNRAADALARAAARAPERTSQGGG